MEVSLIGRALVFGTNDMGSSPVLLIIKIYFLYKIITIICKTFFNFYKEYIYIITSLFNFLFYLFYNYFIKTSLIISIFLPGLKIIIVLIFLILMRAGLPRYRYDYISKLGWGKFLMLLLIFFIIFYIIFKFI